MAIVHFVNYKRGTQSRAAMRGVMLYVMQEKKTAWEGAPLVSGINCQPQSVYDDFLNTKLLYHKDGGVMFYHMVQSFPKGAAVDPRQAHEAARRLAEYFDGCEVLVCTHVDREHIHSHCVINSVNFETGKKLHMAKEQLQELMRRNDMICQEMGLPVFEPTDAAGPRHERRGIPHGSEGPKLEAAAHEHHRRVHEIRRRQGRLRFSDGIRGLRGALGEQPQIHHLHHAGRTKMPRQQTTRRKVLQGGHGA